MARSRAVCAEDRELMYDGDIRRALGAGDDWKAVKKAVDYLLSEACKRRERQPADGALINSDLAGVLRCLASSVPDLPPARPRLPSGDAPSGGSARRVRGRAAAGCGSGLAVTPPPPPPIPLPGGLNAGARMLARSGARVRDSSTFPSFAQVKEPS